MNYTVIKDLPDIQSLMNAIPLTEHNRIKINQDREDIKRILSGEDERMIMIVVPVLCMAKTGCHKLRRKATSIKSGIR